MDIIVLYFRVVIVVFVVKLLILFVLLRRKGAPVDPYYRCVSRNMGAPGIKPIETKRNDVDCGVPGSRMLLTLQYVLLKFRYNVPVMRCLALSQVPPTAEAVRRSREGA